MCHHKTGDKIKDTMQGEIVTVKSVNDLVIPTMYQVQCDDGQTYWLSEDDAESFISLV